MMLVLVTLFLGVSYLLMDTALEDLEPFTLNFIRFFGVFVITAAVSFPKIRNVNKIKLMYSTLTCVFTPVLGLIFKKQIPDKKFIFVIVICFAGIALLSLDENLKPVPGI